MKITIDRSKWGPSLLLNAENGDMCCLGQAAEQCGTSLEALTGRSMMSAAELRLDVRMEMQADNDLLRAVNELAGYQLGNDALVKSALAYLNDAYHRTPADSTKRQALEAAIAAGFLSAGYEIAYA